MCPCAEACAVRKHLCEAASLQGAQARSVGSHAIVRGRTDTLRARAAAAQTPAWPWLWVLRGMCAAGGATGLPGSCNCREVGVRVGATGARGGSEKRHQSGCEGNRAARCRKSHHAEHLWIKGPEKCADIPEWERDDPLIQRERVTTLLEPRLPPPTHLLAQPHEPLHSRWSTAEIYSSGAARGDDPARHHEPQDCGRPLLPHVSSVERAHGTGSCSETMASDGLGRSHSS